MSCTLKKYFSKRLVYTNIIPNHLLINYTKKMKIYEKLLLENKAWAEERKLDDPGFFSRLSDIQTARFFMDWL